MMRIIYILLVAVICSSVFTGCKKDPVYRNIHMDTVIAGNTPPDFNGVAGIIVQNFVNRTYIDLLGREPLEDEFNAALNILYSDSLSAEAKAQVADLVISKNEYYDQLYESTRIDLLLSEDSSTMYDMLGIDSLLKLEEEQKPDSIKNQLLIDYYTYEMQKLYALLAVKEDYKNNIIDINEFYRRFIYNQVYDEINMGSENFVKAVFEDLFLRLPTAEELNAGVQMVDGLYTTVFLQEGVGKSDFAYIATHSNDFYAGLVVKQYKKLLLRGPDSQELAAEVPSLKLNNSLSGLQKRIIKTEEYAGF